MTVSYRYSLTTIPPPDVLCPICHDILEEPHLTDCCGNHFCKGCITKLTTHECPVCRKGNFTAIRNKNFERNSLGQLTLECPNRRSGCTWVDQLGDLEKHLGQCLFEETPCPYGCGERYPRRCVRVHQTDLCPKRPYSCRYCKHQSTHDDITGRHHELCDKYPVDCPNGCSVGKVERALLQSHLKNECPSQPVSCDYTIIGCSFKGTRQELLEHEEQMALHHTSAVAKLMLTNNLKMEDSLVTRMEAQFADITKQMLLQQDEIKSLTDTVLALKHVIGCLHTQLMEMEKTVTILKINRLCLPDAVTSSPFYTHPHGYKLRLRVLTEGEELGIYTYIVPGEYDNCLKWPFKGTIRVEVLNQLKDENHFSYIFDYSNASPHQCCRATRLMSESLHSMHPGLPKSALTSKNGTCYIKNNCLLVKVTVLSL